MNKVLARTRKYGAKPLLGAVDLDNLTQQDLTSSTIFAGVENTAAFNHNPKLFFHDGLYWCAWSQGLIGEGETGQVVKYATSTDGLSWSSSATIDPEVDDNIISTSCCFLVRDNDFWAITIRKSGKFDPAPGMTPQVRAWKWLGSSFDEQFVDLGIPYIIQSFEMLPNGEWATWGTLNPGDGPTAGDGGAWFLTGGVAAIDDWVSHETEVIVGVEPREAHWLVMPDGRTLHTMFRDRGGSLRLGQHCSFDYGRTWEKARRTNFPDARSQSSSARLTDGRYVMVNNLFRGEEDGLGRHPLVLAVSDTGDHFDRVTIIRDEPTSPRWEGGAKTPGFQYPNVLAHGDHVFVAYSANKEDILVSRIAIADIT